MGRVFVLKNVRIFYTKTGRMKFVSHLDMNRLMSRIIMRADLPVWYTEGFNRHIYINYAVPLSLGFEGLYEILDIRLTDDGYSLSELLNRLNGVSVPGLVFTRADEPILPTKEIAFAGFKLEFDTAEHMPLLTEFLSRDSIIIRKRDKRGGTKEVNAAPMIKEYSVSGNTLTVITAAGNNANLNPALVINAFFEQTALPPVFFTTERFMLYDAKMQKFA